MKIGIFGLGYVGLTTSACLLQRSFEVIGYELSSDKLNILREGGCPLSEPGVSEAIGLGLESGRMKVASEIQPDDIPDVVLICVGTPNGPDGQADLTAVKNVLGDLQRLAERSEKGYDCEVVLRSTVPPGTLKQLAQEFEALFRRVSVVFYPEFLREGTAMKDFFAPPQTVVGTLSASPAPRKLPLLLTGLGLEYELVDAVVAEALKLSCNAFHALKVSFANEVGRFVASLGGDGTEVMRLLVKDTDLNISPKYLLPGAPYGGSCLPKDTRAFGALARARGINLSLINSCEPSNQEHVDFIVAQVASRQPRTVAVMGIAFKKDTDDVRESPSLRLIEGLAASGIQEVLIHDFLVRPDHVMGVNKRFLEGLLALDKVTFAEDLGELGSKADLLLLMHNDRRYQNVASPARGEVVDVSRWSNLAAE